MKYAVPIAIIFLVFVAGCINSSQIACDKIQGASERDICFSNEAWTSKIFLYAIR